MSARREDVLEYGWLHDDTEEDLGGADWHLDAIRALSTALKSLVRERHWPWHIGDQLTLVGEKPDGKPWRPAPDISIHPRLGPQPRQELDVRVEGPLSLVLEAASASTWTYDVSLESTRRGRRQAGKRFGYLVLLGIPEYLVFDPHAEFLPQQVQACRRAGDVIQEWRPEADGRYHSAELGISFRPDDALLRVFDPEGAPVPYWFENAELAQRARALEQENAMLRAELERLR